MWSLRRKSLEIPDGRRGAARTRGEDAGAGQALRQRQPLVPPYPGGDGDGLFRPRLLLGRRAHLLAAAGRLHHRGRLCRRPRRPTRPTRKCARGLTGHTEAVLVVYDPKRVSYDALLKAFWESHDPTQGMRQGNDVGTQYRSAIYWTTPEQRSRAEASRVAYDEGAGEGATRRDHDRDRATRRRSITPRIITSNISPRTRWAIAASAAPA